MKSPSPALLTTRRRRTSSSRSDPRSSGNSSREDATSSATSPIPSLQDAEIIFQTKSIAEIQEKRKEFYGGIEFKREELRLLVGKRYTGLIEVADGITEMKSSVESVTSAVSGLHELCTKLKKQHKNNTVKNVDSIKSIPDSEVLFYSITSQVKFLLTVAPRLWSSLEENAFTHSARLFLLAKHVHQGLKLETTSPNSTQILPFFPVVSRHWPTIARFRSTIVSRCRAQLTSPTLTSAEAVDALVAIVALDGVTVRQVFADFLLARTEALNQVFGSAASASASIKEQLSLGISILLLSLKLVYDIFNSPENSPESVTPDMSLVHKLSLLTLSASPELESDVISCCGPQVAAALPAAVKDYRPSLRGQATTMPLDQIQARCTSWMEVSLSSLRSSLSSQLRFVASVKGVANIRDVVSEVLARPDIAHKWKLVSNSLLGRDLCIWPEVVRPLLLQRLEQLLKTQLVATVDGLIHKLRQLEDPSDDCGGILSFVWSESNDDIPNISFGEGKTAYDGNSSQLKMKTNGRIPKVQQICTQFDQTLKDLLIDVNHFSSAKDVGVSIVNIEDDVTFVSSLFTRSCHESFQHFFNFVDEQGAAAERRHEGVNKLLLFGRVCESLPDLSPHLFKALVPSEMWIFKEKNPDDAKSFISTRRSHNRMSRSLLTSAVKASSTDQALFCDVKEDLLKRFWDCWAVWRRLVCNLQLVLLKSNLMATDVTSVLTSSRLTSWETIEIGEDVGDESSETTTSIRVPIQASPGIHLLLHQLCRQVNLVGGYTVPKPVLQTLVDDFLKDVVVIFQDVITKDSEFSSGKIPLNQTLATQWVFDLRFFNQLLLHKGLSDGNRKGLEALVSDLESRLIDPFDLDVISPHLVARVSRHVMRSTALYGLLTLGCGVGRQSSTVTGAVSNERAMALLLCSTNSSSSLATRFQTVPMAATSSGSRSETRRVMTLSTPSSPSNRRKNMEATMKTLGVDGMSPSVPKVPSWSAGLSKLATRDGSNSPSDFFKSGAALYASWFGSGTNENS